MKERIEKLMNDVSFLRLIAAGVMLPVILAGVCGGVAIMLCSMYTLGVLVIVASVFVSLLAFFLMNMLANVAESVINTEATCDRLNWILTSMKNEQSGGEGLHFENEEESSEECDGDTPMTPVSRMYVYERLYDSDLITYEEYTRKLEEICCGMKDGKKTFESMRRKIKDPDDFAVFLKVFILSREDDV